MTEDSSTPTPGEPSEPSEALPDRLLHWATFGGWCPMCKQTTPLRSLGWWTGPNSGRGVAECLTCRHRQTLSHEGNPTSA